MVSKSVGAPAPRKRMGGRKPRPVVEFPAPLFDAPDDPPDFREALSLQMRRHGDTPWSISRALYSQASINETTLRQWRDGTSSPNSEASGKALRLIEKRYRLPQGYFKAKLPNSPRGLRRPPIAGVSQHIQQRLAWHLPDDFLSRPPAQQQEIVAWVRRVMVSGCTEFRQFRAAAGKNGFAVRFGKPASLSPSPQRHYQGSADSDHQTGTIDPSPKLAEEMADLLRFKTATLTPFSFERRGVWNEATATQMTHHFGLLFGSFAASPKGMNKGLGVPLTRLTFAMLVFPSVWDWYLRWRYERRGFFTEWEFNMLLVVVGLTRVKTGWLRQSPHFAERLRPIEGLFSARDIRAVAADWDTACNQVRNFAVSRVRDIKRIARVHRDPFEPILVILEAPSPLSEYRKIADEILKRMPDERRFPIAAAESVRSFLMIRLGLHLGVRQKNLRQLLFRQRGESPTPERCLIEKRRGELRWCDRDNGWEVFIPSAAFKNAESSFFAYKPFRLILPDLAELYRYIDDYLARHRRKLLRGQPDPGAFFVKTIYRQNADPTYDHISFYRAWRLIIQRFGIYNPYTGRGAIRGLLPHGPHNVRDVLATHVLKVTGSFEQASYAIQDTPRVVAKRYGRFLPRDKTALAAEILNKVWEAA